MVLEKFDQETTRLIPDKLEMISPIELTQHYIRDWKLKHFNSGSVKQFQLMIHIIYCKVKTRLDTRLDF